MPYKIRKKGSGYKVCKKNGSKCFSKKKLSLKKAKKQLAAIQIHARDSVNYFENLIESVLNESSQQ